MPYRYAHVYLLLLFPLTLLAFWPSYFAVLPAASWPIHFHGVIASLWIALLAWQSWTIHHGRTEQHRAAGLASLAVFPFFLASNLLIVHSVAGKFVTGENPFAARFGARLAILDLIATAAIAFLYWSALRWRREVHLHARFMLATVFFLFAPIFARVFRLYVPPLAVVPPEFDGFLFNVQLANFATLLLAVALAARLPKHARPWLMTAAAVAVQMVAFETLGGWAAWEAVVLAIAALPASLVFSSGLAAGALVAWLGWSAVPPRVAGRIEPA